MKDRVQIWMSREDFKALDRWIASEAAADLTDERGGPLLALATAIEDAHSNNADYNECEGAASCCDGTGYCRTHNPSGRLT